MLECHTILGQSNLSTEVAALIQSEMASQSRRRAGQPQLQLPQQNGQNGGRDSPDMDFLEMDFDPGDSDSEDIKTQESTPELILTTVPADETERPQELNIEQNSGNASAPLQSPATLDLSQNLIMTRSRSLNSALTLTNNDQATSSGNKRRHSGKYEYFPPKS